MVRPASDAVKTKEGAATPLAGSAIMLYGSVVRRSIQLSYGRALVSHNDLIVPESMDLSKSTSGDQLVEKVLIAREGRLLDSLFPPGTTHP